MTNAQDSEPSSAPDHTDAPPSSDWYAEQWAALVDLLEVSDAREVVARVRTLQEEASQDTEPDRASISSELAEADRSTGENPEELLDWARDTVDGLDALATELGIDVPSPDATNDLRVLLRTAHEQVDVLRRTAPSVAQDDDIADVLGIASVEEARELDQTVRGLSSRLDRLTHEKNTLAENLGVSDAEAILDLVQSMEGQLVDLYRAADGAPRESTEDGEPAESIASSSPSQNGSPESMGEILGISSLSEARELDQLVRRMGTELDRLRGETAKLAAEDLTPETALEMIDTMEEQLVALYQSHDAHSSLAEAVEPVEQILGVVASADEDGAPRLTDLTDKIQALIEEGRSALPDDTDITTVRELIHELGSRWERVQEERDKYAERAERLTAIEDVLGISSVDEAEDLSSLVQNLDSQLKELYAEREKLDEVGLSSVEDAIDMIQSMKHQLQELYEEQEALQDQPDEPATEQDTFQQLESLYKEQEKLNRALGVSSAEDIIAMVEDLSAQLDDAYSTQDNSSDASDEEASSTEVRMTLKSMRHQLEMLYKEKEVLLQRGFESAEEATVRIDHLEARLRRLREQQEECRALTDRLRTELGTADASEIVQMVRDGQLSRTSDSTDSSAPPSSKAVSENDPFVDAAPTLVSDDVLAELSEMSADERDELSAGVLRLDDEGRIQVLNENGLHFPGFDEGASREELLGTRLFERAPQTTNALFLGRFLNGVEQGQMDARFPYTFVTPGTSPTVFYIHLYRAGPDRPNWLLFQPA